MIHVVSPAKSLDFKTEPKLNNFTIPDFLEKSSVLIERLRKQSRSKLKNLMSISEDLVQLNIERYSNWEAKKELDITSKQAVFAFNGDVYQGLSINSLTESDIDYAQKNLRILSGLYGILRPLDLIEPHRLEMGTKLKVGRANNLYEYWRESVTIELNSLVSNSSSNVLLNLASNEYFKVIDKKLLNANVISPEFKDFKNGNYKIISFFAKKARGLMSRYLIENEIEKLEDIKGFDLDGYIYNTAMSSETKPVFTREERK